MRKHLNTPSQTRLRKPHSLKAFGRVAMFGALMLLAGTQVAVAQGTQLAPAATPDATAAPLTPPVVASPAPADPPPLKAGSTFWQDRIKARATERWALIANKNYEESYAYLSEASRAFTGISLYQSQLFSNHYVGGAVEAVECDAAICNVSIMANVNHRIPKIGTRLIVVPLRETWIVEKGDAWLLRR